MTHTLKEPHSGTLRTHRLLALAAGVLALLAFLPGKDQPRAAAQQAAAPAEWAYIPPESVGFLHLRFAEFWDGEMAKYLRQHVPAEMPAFERDMEELIGTRPSELAQLTLVLVKLPDPGAAGGRFERQAIPVDIPIPPKPAELPKAVPIKDKDFPKEEEPREELPGAAQVPVGREDQPAVDDPFGPTSLTIATTRRAYDRDKIRGLLKEAREQKHQGKTYYTESGPKFFRPRAVAFLNETTYVMGPPGAVRRALELPAKAAAKGPATAALALAGKPHQVVVGFQMTQGLVEEWKRELEGGPFRGIESGLGHAMMPLREMKYAALGVDLGRQSRAQLLLQFADAARAKAAVGAVQDALVLLRVFVLGSLQRQMEFGLADVAAPGQEDRWTFGQLFLQRVEAALRAAVVEQRGNDVSATAQAATDVSALLTEAQALAKTRQADPSLLQARNRRRSANNLKQIGLALHHYHDTYNHLPPAALTEPARGQDGKPLLSWRVAILPYVEEDNLFKQFKMDEPWDGPHNKTLIAKMPKLYAPVGVKTKEPHTTFYQVFSGRGAGFEGTRGLRFANFSDGLSNTLLVVEAAEPVIWTKPDDLPYDPKKPPPKVGGLFEDGFHALFGDGSVSFLRKEIDEKSLRLLIERADGHVIDRHRWERR